MSDKKPSGMDVIKAKRLDGPKAGEVKHFKRIDFNRIASHPQYGIWEVVEDSASKPKPGRKPKVEDSKSEENEG